MKCQELLRTVHVERFFIIVNGGREVDARLIKLSESNPSANYKLFCSIVLLKKKNLHDVTVFAARFEGHSIMLECFATK
jgi:hypothetical protein